MEVFEQCMENIKPQLEVKARRGWRHLPGADRNPPGAPPDAGHRWLTMFLAHPQRKDHERAAGQRIMDAANAPGNTVKRREDTHRMAEANKAFCALSLVKWNKIASVPACPVGWVGALS